MRTSLTHPLQIAEIATTRGGVIGVTFCPGKHQLDAVSGSWARDLDTDLDAIASWGAQAVVTLVTPSELIRLNARHMGERVQAREMQWFHLPIEDVSVPTPEWEHAWQTERAPLHAILDGGGRILVHCKGGLGRAGTIAARLLMERGVPTDEAIKRVRAVRSPMAIEGPQEGYLRTLAVSPA